MCNYCIVFITIWIPYCSFLPVVAVLFRISSLCRKVREFPSVFDILHRIYARLPVWCPIWWAIHHHGWMNIPQYWLFCRSSLCAHAPFPAWHGLSFPWPCVWCSHSAPAGYDCRSWGYPLLVIGRKFRYDVDLILADIAHILCCSSNRSFRQTTNS